MRLWILAIVLAAVVVTSAVYLRSRPSAPSAGTAAGQSAVGCGAVERDYAQHRSGVWVTLDAAVERLLPDEYGRLRHQRFIVRCADGQTILIVNDVSIGTRAPVSIGGMVGVRGQYVWNRLGGLIHFTHHNDSGGQGGWVLWRGRVYS